MAHDSATTLHLALARVRRRWTALLVLRLVTAGAIAVAVCVAAAAIAARLTDWSDGATLALAALTCAGVAAACLRVAWPHRHPPADARVARFVEERCPELDDTIAAAVDVAGQAAPPAFAPFVVEAAVERLTAVDPDRLVSRAAFRAAAVRAALGLSAAALAAILAAPLASRTFEIVRVRYFPSTFAVQVTPGSVRVVAGSSVRIDARLDAGGEPLTRVAPVLEIESGGERRTVAMVPTGSGFGLNLERIDRSFRYRVRAGGALSDTYDVTALFPPRIKSVDVHYDYPSFTSLPARDDPDGGDVYAPAGTRVRLRIRADKPVAAGSVVVGDQTLPVTRLDDRTFESQLTLRQDASYRVAVADADGLRAESVEYFIRLVADRPPEIHIVRPAGDQQITPLEEVTIEARADDDYGVASMDMVYSVAGGPEHVVPFTTLAGSETARVGSHLLAAEELGVQPGDVVAYYARARDVPHAKASTLAHSEIFFLEVKPFNEEYSLAQSQAMAASTGDELQGLISAQKEVISATWNLQRRAAAGSSAADVESVAKAQAEVKVRAEKAAGSVRPRRRGFERMLEQFGRQLPPQAGAANPVADAAAAMGRALDHLNAGSTKDAISPEMAALNALLKAEAEIRQRQITQARNGTNSFGGGRQGQDLSNLFDRELKRQQRTNYESKSQIEQPSARETGTSALDRIRDLARRQEDLAKAQRELAGSKASEDERRRQLERLTREQEELRRQLEALARQEQQAGQPQPGQQQSGQPQSREPQPGQQQGGQPQAPGAASANGQGSPAGQQSGASSETPMRDALEQMRQSASELQRQDAGRAAARAADAAQQLRDAEQRMQSGTPGAPERALGDLQLESQQMAAAQRQLAAEADRLQQDGTGAADARHRLAGKKEDLADRLERFRDRAARLGKDGSAPQAARDAANAAAGALDSQQLAGRMRQGAAELRGGGKAAPDREQQLADALDGLARTIGGADAGGANGETARLADDLDAVRQAREHLARLQQQIAEARRQAEGRGARGSSPGRAGDTGANGRQGRNGSTPGGQGSGELSRLQDEYARELQRTRQLVDRLERGRPSDAQGMATPEQHEWSQSAPGTEAWKQDFAKWDALGRDISRDLERVEGRVADRLSKALARDRLAAGGSERVPDNYAERVARYYELLAQVKRR